jgi:DNA-binding MarR family transcriptional regulator/N-acetylglutamate synthase-like GNAT family acetyltransferase
MATTGLAQRVSAVRRFNRFYTRQIGLLEDGYLESEFSLTEVRVLYELAQTGQTTASDLGKLLRLDDGYLSRILRGFVERGLVSRTPSPTDGRQALLRLTDTGREAFAPLDARSRDDIGTMLSPLAEDDQSRLISAMETIERMLGDRSESTTPWVLRSHRPGDMGWVVHRHGVLYAREYGWDERFEALVAGIVATFIEQHDPKREHCWIAERDGEVIGSVFLVKQSEKVAKLRLLLVEPSARGLGIGARLIEECVRFARLAGYRRVTLWTNDCLLAARHLYERAGFRLVDREPHHSFGHDLVAETWELSLGPMGFSSVGK